MERPPGDPSAALVSPLVVIAAMTAIVTLGFALLASHPAIAGSVRGQIKFSGSFGDPPKRSQGFVDRIANPIRPVRSFDPSPYLVVVFEAETEEQDDSSRRTATYKVLGTTFAAEILPVQVNTRVEIDNQGPTAVTLSAPDHPDLLGETELGPNQTAPLQITEPERVVVIRATTRPYPVGRIVAFRSRYFAQVDRRGQFSIDDIPEGTWKARLWYRDGWVDGVEKTFTVTRKRGEVELRVSPGKLPKPGAEPDGK